MFCYQCQEAAGCKGCTIGGACGKKPETATLQDAQVYALKGLAIVAETAGTDAALDAAGLLALDGLFETITNANFDNARFVNRVGEIISLRDELAAALPAGTALPACATWAPANEADMLAAAAQTSVLATENEDVRSLRELLVYGIKGVAAYAHHAMILGETDPAINAFMVKALAATVKDLSADELTGLVLEAGGIAVTTMALLDAANTSTFGNPELSEVNLGVGTKPGILVSGHDLLDIKELLEQTEGTGVDVYTHCEMLPSHYYPELKKYTHLVGNYGSSWFHQSKEFAAFNGPILMTTNCITPVRDKYSDRMYTSGAAGYPGLPHIAERPDGGQKDFSALIEQAKTCAPPTELETGKIVGGFAHSQVLALADKVVEAVKAGAIKRFVVMAGCDGRQSGREYFTDVAKELPADTIILTAGCAKYRYNKLDLGDIGGIPRVLDAGQCNDCYSLAVIALKLQEVFGLESINDLPLSFDVGWYEQKAVAVLLALLHLGVKNIRLGPTLPAFLSPNVAQVLIDAFDIKGTTTPAEDVAAMMAGA
ncbi:MAG: hydroxylamine reductase [Lentisphaerae bacterium]|nr:hydroxylamine reductase [Lentisphaerota bacterium]MBT4821657.1 hydroxylamine reductase [Lentisphaerota bacterium]MBT5612899.1 hydroxylamine reductase [Lentisphaerota bacterium]MBT7060955.1 hydroxylamine reductase [Lentisphaerota bacterium]MBT7846980.1 hydroxylamine reductase [Lentisphaerota bacterium]